MPYTFEPKKNHARAYGNNLRISVKASTIVCRAIRKKPLKRAKRLLENLLEQRQSLEGKYYTKAVRQILMMVNSCEKNAEFKGLDTGKLMVYASASFGPNFRRRRRKANFGSKMKMTNIEVILIEEGKESKTQLPRKTAKKAKPEPKNEMKSDLGKMKAHSDETKHHVHEVKEKMEASQ